MLTDVAIADEYTEGIETELKDYFQTLTSASAFTDTIWFLDKLKRSAGHSDGNYKIYFASIPAMYRDVVRFWVLLRLRNGGAVSTQSSNVVSMANCLKFFIKEVGAPDLSEINRLVIEAYEDYLLPRRDISKSSKECWWSAVNNFFKDMQTWPYMPDATPVAPGNPFSRTELDRKHSQRLVPEMVLEQLDLAYRDERVPLEDRLCYWILRSIPSRVGELCSIRLKCLRPYVFNGRKGFILTVPDYKQAANQHKARKKLIHILDEGHGKFLLDMVRAQQKVAKELQDVLPESDKGYLMISPHNRMINAILAGSDQDRKLAPFILTGPTVRRRMKQMTEHFKVIGTDGKSYDLITHCFRHNGITERLYEGFTFVEIRDMSGHHGTQMLTTSYVHVKDEEIKARAKERRERGEQGPPVLFRGRIMNMSTEKEEQLLKTPRAYRIGNLGICSDVTSCGSDLFECLDCEYLVPDADNEDYYAAEYGKWADRIVKHTKSGNRSLAEQASYMAQQYEKLLDRIRLSLFMQAGEATSG
ncbi:hypothetical protein E4633_20235 [Geomonas terrae]|uniref:Tyr recombinase domain-containing protein n=1 Tax=Geomonas terrae TaxID=2562681 RepID=A0A4S1C9Y6_9BACT|nr:tyrosine-type recombinase/integrase [Geomonas terrae]TGU69923.1 hypothetical protein E4633_20235 [Geomonas terrae]